MIQLCGRDHRYSISERETFLKSSAYLRRGTHVFLQTCNRVEIYSGDGDTPPEVARHLFRVVSGLESRLIGERHIQGQVRRAYREAIENRSVSPGLHRLFQTALRIGKKVRSETGISLGAVSYSSAVMNLLRQELTVTADFPILVIGVNRTNETIVRYLLKAGCKAVTIANRSFEKARTLGIQLGVNAVGLEKLADALKSHSVVITATSSDQPIIVQSVMPHKGQHLIVDLAVPRDVDPAVCSLPNVRVFNVSEVESRIEQNLLMRRHEIEKAQQIIEQAVFHFSKALQTESLLC